jgi:uncharacterized phage protein (TIGR02218 family)
MKTVSTELKNHLAQEVTTIATCWKITRTDEVIKGFTDFESNITFDAVEYIASAGFMASSVSAKDDLAVDNMDINSFLDSDHISEEDISNGVYDFAEIEVFIVNYKDLSQGRMLLIKGKLGEVEQEDETFKSEIRGVKQRLSQNIGRLYAPSCDATLGDSKCGVNLASYTFSSTVTAVTDNKTFTANSLTQDSNYFVGGEVEFTSGDNSGKKMEVKEFRDKQVTLALPMPYSISVDDEFDIIAGCNKSKTACKNKFDNLVNFRGYPDIPGIDTILKTGGTSGNG